MTLRILADECVAGSTVAALRDAGLDIVWVAEAAPGQSDRAVLDSAYEAPRLLLTEDKDFGELALRMGYRSHGVVLLALFGLSPEARAERAVAGLLALGDKAHNHFTVVEQGRIRRRQLPAGTDKG